MNTTPLLRVCVQEGTQVNWLATSCILVIFLYKLIAEQKKQTKTDHINTAAKCSAVY